MESNAIGWPPIVTEPVERTSDGWKNLRGALSSDLLAGASVFGGCFVCGLAWRACGAAVAPAANSAAVAGRIGNFITLLSQPSFGETRGRESQAGRWQTSTGHSPKPRSAMARPCAS